MAGQQPLGFFQHPALVAFEAPEIIGPQFLGDESRALLLIVEGVPGDEAASQVGQRLQERFERRYLVALFLNRHLRQRQTQTMAHRREKL